jgi:hypothetical protein
VRAIRQKPRHRHRVLDLDGEREPICEDERNVSEGEERVRKKKDEPDSAPVRQTTTDEEERLCEWMHTVIDQRRLLEQKAKGKKRVKRKRTPTVTITKANHSFALSLNTNSPSSIPAVFPIKLGIFPCAFGSLASSALLSAPASCVGREPRAEVVAEGEGESTSAPHQPQRDSETAAGPGAPFRPVASPEGKFGSESARCLR